MNEQYYLSGGCCPEIPARYENYLDKSNYLSEFSTNAEKEIVRLNLGLEEILRILNLKIDNKVIQQSGVAWDLQPTENNTDKVLSSDAVYKALLNYVLKSTFDETIQQLWTRTVEKVDELSGKVNGDLNTLKVELQNSTDALIESILKDPETDSGKAFKDLQLRMDNLILIVNSFLANATQGTALALEFGDSDYIGINLKTITSALNKLWDKIESITGEPMQGINMIVSPKYFISEDGCTVTISATSFESTGLFEHIAFYADGVLIGEASDVETFTTTIHVDKSTSIKCVAKILGIEYEKNDIITHYNSFWLFSAPDTSHLSEYLANASYIIPITNGMRGVYNVSCQRGDRIIIVVGKSLASGFLRADLNGLEIPFTKENVTINGEELTVFTSVNTYNAGVYNIDVNG